MTRLSGFAACFEVLRVFRRTEVAETRQQLELATLDVARQPLGPIGRGQLVANHNLLGRLPGVLESNALHRAVIEHEPDAIVE